MLDLDKTNDWNEQELTLEELRILVEEERENMHSQERYIRIRDNDPTFLEYVLSWASQKLKDNPEAKILINELTYEYKIIQT